MLAFDIETTGLDPKTNKVTVVCTEDYASGHRTAYEFARCASDEERSKMIEDMAAAFDSASSLCAFNGVRFDIPFLATAFSFDNARVSEWVFKTSDILEFSRLVLSSTFSLDLLCKHNNIQTKSASGLEAVRMAANGEWDRLRDYCTDDVRILCDIYRLRMVTHPRSGAKFDLAEISEGKMYDAGMSMCNESEAATPDTEEVAVKDGEGMDEGETTMAMSEASEEPCDY